jgi:PAS domain S-box-containing protein
MASLGKFASSAYQAVQSIDDLRFQAAEREKAEKELRELTDGLETQVRARTAELEHRNTQLSEARVRLALEKLALERSEAYLAEAERLSHTGSWHWNFTSGEVFWSKEFFSICGFDLKEDQPSYQSYVERIHPEDRAKVVKARLAAITEKGDFETEYRLLLPGGSVKHVYSVGRCSVSQSGDTEFTGAIMDITERKRAEATIRRSEKELRDAIETIPTSAWTTLADGSVEFVNRGWREYTGLSGEGSLGSGWRSAVHPEDVDQHVGKWQKSVATGDPFENEVRYRRSADGKYRWFLVRAVPLRDELGNILKWYGISTDIEDRRRAEGMLAGEKRILEMVARGDSLAQILDSLCRLVEEQDPDVLASVSLVVGNRLRHGGAPSLPEAYKNAIDGIVIGSCAGSCGTAAFLGEQVIVTDIATDPVWADYREAALAHSLRACWSTPVFSPEGKVMATFAMYYREPRSFSVRDKEIIEQVSHLAGVAIQHTLAEEKLRRSEAYAAEAQGLSHTGSWHWNVSTGEVAWSQEYCAIFGFDFEKDKPTYQLFIERVHPEDRPKVEQVLWADAREKKDFDGEYRLLLPGGSIKYLHSLGKCSVGQSGDVEYIGAVVDITEHKRAEQELRDSEEKHRVVIETASDAVVSMDENGAILRANAATLRIFGYDPVELIGKPLTVLMPEFLRKMHEAGFRNYLATGHRHINWQGSELTGLRKDGQEFPVEISFGELIKDGHRIFTGFIRDISERKRAEEALRRSESYLAEAQRLTHTGSWAGNIFTGEIFHSSDEHSRLYGLDPRKGIPSFEDLHQRVHPEDQARLVETFVCGSREGADVDVHYRIVLPDGTTKNVKAVGHPVLNQSGEPGEFVGFLMDVTERKRAEEERERLRQAQADLAHINRVSTMGELTASLAHEIKQPISAAIANAETCLEWLARDRPDITEAQEAASRIIRDVTRASNIITRIGSLYKKDVPQRKWVNVNELIQEMIALLRGEAARYSISVHGELADGLPNIMADRVGLQQVLMNLMVNGIEAMKGTSTPRKLTISSEKNGNNQLVVSVADTGVGLQTENANQIFDAFFTSKSQGTGMGLTISQSIIESHGGRLWTTPNPGSGATFQFVLPVETAAPAVA